MLIGTANVNERQMKNNCRPNCIPLFLGIKRILSIPYSAKAGSAIGHARNILELAVYITALLAAIFDLPRGAPVSGSSISIPLFISA